MRALSARAALAGCQALALSLAVSAPLKAQCLPGISCGFSVKGKNKQPYLGSEVTNETLAKADAESSTAQINGRSLDSVSVNRGAFSGTGIAMPETERQLSAVLKRLRDAWPLRAPPAMTIRMIGSSSYGPASHPDNVIVIPLGLIMHAQTDDEVAWVIAHEFNHIALGHFTHNAKLAAAKSSIDKLADCARLGLALADMRFTKAGNQINVSQANDPQVLALSTQVWAKGNLTRDVFGYFDQGLARRLEDQADAGGVDLALLAQYSSDGYGTALHFLQQDEERQKSWTKQFGDQFGGYMKLASGQALANLASGQNGGNVFSGFLNGMVKNAEALFLQKLGKALMADHRPAKQRLKGLGKYMDKAHADVPPVDTTHAWIDALRASAEYREAAVAVNAVDAARLAIPAAPCDIKQPDCVAQINVGAAKAIELLRPALSTRYKTTPLVANTLAYLSFATGKNAEADRLYDMAELSGTTPPAPPSSPMKNNRRVKAAPPAVVPPPVSAPAGGDPYLQQSLIGFSEHVDLLIRMKNYPKALKVIATAKSRFHDDDKFLPAMVTIYMQTKNVKSIAETLARCQKTEDETTRQACTFAFMNPEQQDLYDKLAPADQSTIDKALSSAGASVRTGSVCGLPSAEQLDAQQKAADKDNEETS